VLRSPHGHGGRAAHGERLDPRRRQDLRGRIRRALIPQRDTNHERTRSKPRQTMQIVLDGHVARAYGRPMETTHTPPRAFPAIVVGGLITGVLDMSYAMLVYSPKAPLRIPQGIAAGLLGVNHQLGGETGTILLGFLCHFTIALGAATVFYLASRRWAYL